jgi:hypothetical protein
VRRSDAAEGEEGSMSGARFGRVGLLPAVVGVLAFAAWGLAPSAGRADEKDNAVKADTSFPKEPPVKGIKEGKFVKPAASDTPTSYFYGVSEKGERIGQGQVISCTGDKLKVELHREAVVVVFLGTGYDLRLGAANKEKLKAGEYPDARRFPFNGKSPGLAFAGNSRGQNALVGKFVIWELEVKEGKITRLAVDFIQRRDENAPALYGVLRFNSSFK